MADIFEGLRLPQPGPLDMKTVTDNRLNIRHNFLYTGLVVYDTDANGLYVYTRSVPEGTVPTSNVAADWHHLSEDRSNDSNVLNYDRSQNVIVQPGDLLVDSGSTNNNTYFNDTDANITVNAVTGDDAPNFGDLIQISDRDANLQGAVRFDEAQSLTESQQTQARENIGAGNGGDGNLIHDSQTIPVSNGGTAVHNEGGHYRIGAADQITLRDNGVNGGFIEFPNAAARTALGLVQPDPDNPVTEITVMNPTISLVIQIAIAGGSQVINYNYSWRFDTNVTFTFADNRLTFNETQWNFYGSRGSLNNLASAGRQPATGTTFSLSFGETITEHTTAYIDSPLTVQNGTDVRYKGSELSIQTLTAGNGIAISNADEVSVRAGSGLRFENGILETTSEVLVDLFGTYTFPVQNNVAQNFTVSYHLDEVITDGSIRWSGFTQNLLADDQSVGDHTVSVSITEEQASEIFTNNPNSRPFVQYTAGGAVHQEVIGQDRVGPLAARVTTIENELDPIIDVTPTFEGFGNPLGGVWDQNMEATSLEAYYQQSNSNRITVYQLLSNGLPAGWNSLQVGQILYGFTSAVTDPTMESDSQFRLRVESISFNEVELVQVFGDDSITGSPYGSGNFFTYSDTDANILFGQLRLEQEHTNRQDAIVGSAAPTGDASVADLERWTISDNFRITEVMNEAETEVIGRIINTNDPAITIQPGGGLTTGGTFNTNQRTDQTVSIGVDPNNAVYGNIPAIIDNRTAIEEIRNNGHIDAIHSSIPYAFVPYPNPSATDPRVFAQAAAGTAWGDLHWVHELANGSLVADNGQGSNQGIVNSACFWQPSPQLDSTAGLRRFANEYRSGTIQINGGLAPFNGSFTLSGNRIEQGNSFYNRLEALAGWQAHAEAQGGFTWAAGGLLSQEAGFNTPGGGIVGFRDYTRWLVGLNRDRLGRITIHTNEPGVTGADRRLAYQEAIICFAQNNNVDSSLVMNTDSCIAVRRVVEWNQSTYTAQGAGITDEWIGDQLDGAAVHWEIVNNDFSVAQQFATDQAFQIFWLNPARGGGINGLGAVGQGQNIQSSFSLDQATQFVRRGIFLHNPRNNAGTAQGQGTYWTGTPFRSFATANSNTLATDAGADNAARPIDVSSLRLYVNGQSVTEETLNQIKGITPQTESFALSPSSGNTFPAGAGTYTQTINTSRTVDPEKLSELSAVITPNTNPGETTITLTGNGVLTTFNLRTDPDPDTPAGSLPEPGTRTSDFRITQGNFVTAYDATTNAITFDMAPPVGDFTVSYVSVDDRAAANANANKYDGVSVTAALVTGTTTDVTITYTVAAGTPEITIAAGDVVTVTYDDLSGWDGIPNFDNSDPIARHSLIGTSYRHLNPNEDYNEIIRKTAADGGDAQVTIHRQLLGANNIGIDYLAVNFNATGDHEIVAGENFTLTELYDEALNPADRLGESLRELGYTRNEAKYPLTIDDSWIGPEIARDSELPQPFDATSNPTGYLQSDDFSISGNTLTTPAGDFTPDGGSGLFTLVQPTGNNLSIAPNEGIVVSSSGRSFINVSGAAIEITGDEPTRAELSNETNWRALGSDLTFTQNGISSFTRSSNGDTVTLQDLRAQRTADTPLEVELNFTDARDVNRIQNAVAHLGTNNSLWSLYSVEGGNVPALTGTLNPQLSVNTPNTGARFTIVNVNDDIDEISSLPDSWILQLGNAITGGFSGGGGTSVVRYTSTGSGSAGTLPAFISRWGASNTANILPVPTSTTTLNPGDIVRTVNNSDPDNLVSVVYLYDGAPTLLGTAPASADFSNLSNTLDSLNDTQLSAPISDDQFLRYNGTHWVNETVTLTTSLADLTDTMLSSLSTDQYLRYNGTNWINDTVDAGDRYASEAAAGSPTVTVRLTSIPNDVTFTIDADLSWAIGQRIQFIGNNADGDWTFSGTVGGYTDNNGSITIGNIGVAVRPAGVATNPTTIVVTPVRVFGFGATGPQGPRGPQGVQGEDGVQGGQGQQGPRGFVGPFSVQLYTRVLNIPTDFTANDIFSVIPRPSGLTFDSADGIIVGTDVSNTDINTAVSNQDWTNMRPPAPIGTDIFVIEVGVVQTGDSGVDADDYTVSAPTDPFRATAQGPAGPQGAQGDPGMNARNAVLFATFSNTGATATRTVLTAPITTGTDYSFLYDGTVTATSTDFGAGQSVVVRGTSGTTVVAEFAGVIKSTSGNALVIEAQGVLTTPETGSTANDVVWTVGIAGQRGIQGVAGMNGTNGFGTVEQFFAIRNRTLLTGGFLLARDAGSDQGTREAYTGPIVGEIINGDSSPTYWFDSSDSNWYDVAVGGVALIGF